MGANVGKKKVMRIAHIFFVKVVGAFSEKNLSGNQKVRGGINKEKGKKKMYLQFACITKD